MSSRLVTRRATLRPCSFSTSSIPRKSTPDSQDHANEQITSGPPPKPSKFIPATYDLHPLYNPITNTISVPPGPLPASPVFSPAWRETQYFFRAPKPRGQPPVGRFRKILSRNPYAWMLASPLRLDPMTRVVLPRVFLAEFGVVGKEGRSWFVPRVGEGPDEEKGWGEGGQDGGGREGEGGEIEEVQEAVDALTGAEEGLEIEEVNFWEGSKDAVEPWEAEGETKKLQLEADALQALLNIVDIPPNDPEYIPTPRLPGAPDLKFLFSQSRSGTSQTSKYTNSSSTLVTTPANNPPVSPLPELPLATHSIPLLRGYTALSLPYLQSLDTRLAGPLRNSILLIARRTSYAPWFTTTPPIWRHEMSAMYLDMLRDRCLEDFLLLDRPGVLGKETRKGMGAFVGVDGLEAVEEQTPEGLLRCAVLAVNDEVAGEEDIPKTFTYSDTSYNGTIPVHSLLRLLGPVYLQKLKDAIPIFNEKKWILLVRPMSFHLRIRLWKLEGFLNKEGWPKNKSAPEKIQEKKATGKTNKVELKKQVEPKPEFEIREVSFQLELIDKEMKTAQEELKITAAVQVEGHDIAQITMSSEPQEQPQKQEQKPEQEPSNPTEPETPPSPLPKRRICRVSIL